MYRRILARCPGRQQRVSGWDQYHVISHCRRLQTTGCWCTDTPEGSNKISHGALRRINITARNSGDVTAKGVHLPIDKPLDRVPGNVTVGGLVYVSWGLGFRWLSPYGMCLRCWLLDMWYILCSSLWQFVPGGCCVTWLPLACVRLVAWLLSYLAFHLLCVSCLAPVAQWTSLIHCSFSVHSIAVLGFIVQLSLNVISWGGYILRRTNSIP